jgi:hypothetical protein
MALLIAALNSCRWEAGPTPPIWCMQRESVKSENTFLPGYNWSRLCWLLACDETKALDRKTKTDMNSSTSGWLVLTRNFVAGSHPQNDNLNVFAKPLNY